MPTLDWLTRDDDIKAAHRVPYRLLEADSKLSAGPSAGSGQAASGNMLIQGDNLDALKSLLPYYAGQVKCIYIDPPYNTKSAFEHYDDNLEHSKWLAMIWPRLELLRELLAEDGSIWVNLDENEGHYFKIIGDEIFGRANFVRQVTWQKKYSVSNNYKGIASLTDLIFGWQKSSAFQNNLLPRSEEAESRYTNPDGDRRGPWKAVDYLNQASTRQRPNLVYDIVNPFTQEVVTNRVKAWKYDPETHSMHVAEKRLWWGLQGENSVPALKLFLSEVRAGMTPHNWWPHGDVGHTDEAKKESIALFGGDQAFATPKPERLLHRIVALSTNPGDLVLDSFLGSGTTAAVAHKMGRRWIGIEMGEHAVTHCAPRLNKVIAGEQGGISQAVGWQGGGGFTFYRLGAEVFDAEGRIRAGISFASLAAHVWFSETGVALAMHAPLVTPAPEPESRSVSAGESGTPGQARGDGDSGSDRPLPPTPSPEGQGEMRSPFLGVHDGRGYALLYNGVLGDKRPQGGNVLTNATLAIIREAAGDFAGPLIIYGEASRLSDARLRAESIIFKQTPYDLKAR